MEIVSDENEIESLKRKFEKKLKKYSTAAKKYMPTKINILFVAESPPSSGKYVYFGDETPGALLTTIMKSLNINGPYTKERKIKLLEELKEKGAFIMDAVEYPIDNVNNERERENIIERESENFLNRLNELFKKGIVTKETKIVLIKHSVYNVLYQKLKDCGYNVVNKGKIRFPKYNDSQTVKDINNALGIVF
jgi:hypothetical protein